MAPIVAERGGPVADPTPQNIADDQVFLSRAVEATIRIGLLIALLAWCFEILRPFVLPMAWAIIIAVAVHPAYRWVRTRLGERGRLAAGVVTLLGLVVLILPTLLLGGTLVEGSQTLATLLGGESHGIPAPPETIRTWPLVGTSVYQTWNDAHKNLAAVLQPLRPQIVAFGRWLLATAAGAGFAFLQTLLAIVIAGVLLANDVGGRRAAHSVARRLAGPRGEELATLARATVQSVAQGILGVALIQAVLAGLGFLVVGVPGAGLWALLGLLLCVVQIGLLPVTLPIVIYVFSTAEPLIAALFTIWIVVVSLLDNFLKPLLLGRGVRVPTIIIFLGSIGGFLASGIIGLFVGSVVLVLGFTLFQAWLDQESASPDSTVVE
jgi:predicted PurR-regulated permease PerM